MSGNGGMLAIRDPNQPSNVRRRKRNFKQLKRELGCPTASQKENKTSSGTNQLGSIGGTSTPAASPGASIFGSPSSNIQIHNGQFNATAGNHISVVINAGGGPLPGVNSEVQDNPHGAPAWQSQDETRMATEDAAQAPPRIPVTQRSSEIYYRHLTTKGRGSPLWIPEPNKALRIEYQRNGMRIGDVGIINSRGNFDFLFNICLPLGHPINPRTMPEHFAPLSIDPDDIQKYSEFKGESYLSSGSIKRPSNEAGLGGLLFESSASEGAILTMPVGSNSEDLGNVSLFRRYAALHAENWYNYANLIRGREAGNGDIRLVTGYDKTSAWGMATFSNMSDPLQLAFRPKEDSGVGRTYDWEYSGTAEVRAGPETKEIEELKKDDPSQVGITYENQCLFVRTLNIRLQDTVWKRLASQFGDLMIDNEAEDSFHSQFSSPHSSPAFGRTSTSSLLQSGSIGTSHGSRTVVHDIPKDEAKDFVHVSTSFRPLRDHPSASLNEMLLKLNPTARVAITEDKDWISVMTKEDTFLPSPIELYRRILISFILCEEEGIVFLASRDTKPCDNIARHDFFPIRGSSFPAVVQESRVEWGPMPPQLPNLYHQHSPRHSVTVDEKLCASERFGIPQSTPIKSRARTMTMTPNQECNIRSGKKRGYDITGRSQGFRGPATIGRDEIRQPSPSITLDPPPLLLSLPISSNPELFSGQRVQFETSPFLDKTNADWDQAVDSLPEADGYRMRFVDVSGALASPVAWLDKAT